MGSCGHVLIAISGQQLAVEPYCQATAFDSSKDLPSCVWQKWEVDAGPQKRTRKRPSLVTCVFRHNLAPLHCSLAGLPCKRPFQALALDNGGAGLMLPFYTASSGSPGLPLDDGTMVLPKAKRFHVRVLVACYKVSGLEARG